MEGCVNCSRNIHSTTNLELLPKGSNSSLLGERMKKKKQEYEINWGLLILILIIILGWLGSKGAFGDMGLFLAIISIIIIIAIIVVRPKKK